MEAHTICRLRTPDRARATGTYSESANRDFGVSLLQSIARLITIERLTALHASALHSTGNDAVLLRTNPRPKMIRVRRGGFWKQSVFSGAPAQLQCDNLLRPFAALTIGLRRTVYCVVA